MRVKREYFEHPLDRSGLLNLRGIKWFQALTKYLVAEDLEQDFLLLNLIDNALLNERDFPAVHAHVKRACEVLGVEPLPRIFLDTNPVPHSISIGQREPIMVFSSGLLELLTDDELAAAVAHEVGHLACDHSYYKLLAENFSGIAQLSGVVPGLSAAAFALKLPLYDWYRKADLSADRAALLVLGKKEPVLRLIGKIAGGSGHLAEQISLESLVEQAGMIDGMTIKMKSGSLRQKASYYFSNLVMQGMLRTQPWPAVRVMELLAWSASSECQDLLAGKPPSPRPPPPSSPIEDQPSGVFERWSTKIADTGKWFKFWGGDAADELQDDAGISSSENESHDPPAGEVGDARNDPPLV